MRAVFVALCLLLASPALAATFIVDVETDGNDADPGDGFCADDFDQCPLRAAIQEANALLGADDVVLPTGVYSLTIKRDDDVPDGQSGDIDVTSAITLTGLGDDAACKGTGCTAIDGKRAKDRVFDVKTGGDFVIQDLVIRNGKAANDDDNDAQPGEISGGCIRVDGALAGLTLQNVTVERCSSPDDGGCIGFTENSAGNLTDTFLDRCKAKDGGGGIEADGATLDLLRVTIANSKAVDGGGLEIEGGSAEVRNVTLSRNKGKLGGGIAAEGDATVTVNNTTFADNKGKDSASLFVDDSGLTPPVVTLSNSLLQSSGNTANCLGPVASDGGNVEDGASCALAGSGDCSSCITALDNQLADNGGEIPTQSIGETSFARENGITLSCETTDARDFTRSGTCDSGAFEFGGTP